MDAATTEWAAFKNPRQQGKVSYPLEDILLLCLLAVLAGAETIVDIARAAREHFPARKFTYPCVIS